MNGLPLPLVKICDFGYSKADAQSVAKSKVWKAMVYAIDTSQIITIIMYLESEWQLGHISRATSEPFMLKLSPLD